MSGDDRSRSLRPPIAVLLVHHHALVRRGLLRLLQGDPDITVIAEANDEREAIRLADRLRPSVIVMDCGLPRLFSTIGRLVCVLSDVPILLLGTRADNEFVRQAIEIGVRGYVLVTAHEPDFGSAVKRVAAGETVIGLGAATQRVFRKARCEMPTPRQLEVLQLVCEGHSNKSIANALRLSVHTVAVHRYQLMKSLGVRKTATLVVRAIERGLVTARTTT